MINMNEPKYNYVIAAQWPKSKQLGAYMWHSNVVFYGPIEEAKQALLAAQKASPRRYKIYTLVELDYGRVSTQF